MEQSQQKLIETGRRKNRIITIELKYLFSTTSVKLKVMSTLVAKHRREVHSSRDVMKKFNIITGRI